VAAKATPATRIAQQAGALVALHDYSHDPRAPSYALEAAEALGLDPGVVFKTLVCRLADGTHVVAVVPAGDRLDLKALAAAAGAKGAAMADPRDAERLTGYVTGGISPLGQRKRLATFLDASAQAQETIHVSAGRRGLELEIAPRRLLELTGGTVARLT
jgi:Cys-tRNA(Pro)/Cys-tRNA(Cys) deacylase